VALEELLNTYLPQFSGILGRYWGRNGIHLHSEYLGAAVLVLVAAGIRSGRPRRDRAFRRFWLGVAIVSLLWALGGSTPFFQLVYAIVPGTKFFRAPSTMMFVFGFSLALLSALGTERLLAGKASQRYAVGWLVAGGAIALLATAGAFTSLAQRLVVDPSLMDAVDANARAVTMGAWALVRCRRARRGRHPRARAGQVHGAAGGALPGTHRRRRPLEHRAVLLDVLAAGLQALRRRRDYRLPQEAAAADARGSLRGGAGLTPWPRTTPAHGRRPHGPRHPLVTGYHGNELGRYRMLGNVDEGTARGGIRRSGS